MPSVEIQPGGGMNPRPTLLPVGCKGVRPGTESLEGQYQGGQCAPHLGDMLMESRARKTGPTWWGRNEPSTPICPQKGPQLTSPASSPSDFLGVVVPTTWKGRFVAAPIDNLYVSLPVLSNHTSSLVHQSQCRICL